MNRLDAARQLALPGYVCLVVDVVSLLFLAASWSLPCDAPLKLWTVVGGENLSWSRCSFLGESIEATSAVSSVWLCDRQTKTDEVA